MNAIDFWIHNVLMNITNEKRADIEWIQEVIFSDQQEESKDLFNISGRSVDIFTVKKKLNRAWHERTCTTGQRYTMDDTNTPVTLGAMTTCDLQNSQWSSVVFWRLRTIVR